MPKVKPLIRPDPWKIAYLSEIGGGMKAMNLTIKDLARLTGINRTTLQSRIGKNGNIGSMRLDELEAIRKVFKNDLHR